MKTVKRMAEILFRLILCVGCSAGIAWNIIIAAPNLGSILSYYTIQSNMVCLIFFAVLVVLGLLGRVPDSRGYHLLKGAVTLCITVTFLVYHFVLRPQFFGMEGGPSMGTANMLVHYFTPLMVIFDYLFFDQKGKFKPLDPVFWLGVPLLYLVYINIYRVLGGRFHAASEVSEVPYFFLDTTIYGFWGVVLWVVGLCAGIVALGYLFYGLDRLLFRLSQRFLSKENASPKG